MRADDVFFGGMLIMCVLLLVGLVGGLFLGFAGVGSSVAPSTYSGYVVDAEHNKGVVLRTTQIHVKTHPRSSSSELFCVRTEDGRADLERARKALRNGDRVRIEYRRPLFVSPLTCEQGTSIVTSIEVVNSTEGSS